MLSLKRDRTPGVTLAHNRTAITLLICLFSIAAGSSAQGLGDLTVSPTRIVFDGRQRSEEVMLMNRSSEAITYRISFKNMRMLEDGSYEDIEIAESGELFADHMIRYAPRQVTLEPGTSQTVRLLLRKPADLPPGEYRSHLWFRAIPPETAGTDIEDLDLEESDIQVQITTVLAVTIPVTVIHGDLSATVEFSDVALKRPDTLNESPVLCFRLNRSGERSVSGEVNVTYVPDDSDDERVVGFARGIAVLSPCPSRTVDLPLSIPEDLELQSGRLTVVYRARPEAGGAVLAETSLRIP